VYLMSEVPLYLPGEVSLYRLGVRQPQRLLFCLQRLFALRGLVVWVCRGNNLMLGWFWDISAVSPVVDDKNYSARAVPEGLRRLRLENCRLGNFVTVVKAINLRIEYPVIYDSGSVPDQSIFSPRETSTTTSSFAG